MKNDDNSSQPFISIVIYLPIITVHYFNMEGIYQNQINSFALKCSVCLTLFIYLFILNL
jgi:hypothetical protein